MDLQTQVDIQRTDRGGGRTSTISFCRIAFNSKLRVQSRRALVRFCMLHASLERQNQQGVGEREHCQLFMLHAELAARKSNSAEVGEAEAANDRRPQADNQRPRVGGYHATLPIQLKASATVALHNTATHFAPLKLTYTLGAGCHSSHAQPSTPPGPYWAPAAVHASPPNPTLPHTQLMHGCGKPPSSLLSHAACKPTWPVLLSPSLLGRRILGLDGRIHLVHLHGENWAVDAATLGREGTPCAAPV